MGVCLWTGEKDTWYSGHEGGDNIKSWLQLVYLCKKVNIQDLVMVHMIQKL